MHVITAQVTLFERIATVQADILVAPEQRTVGQWRFAPDLVEDFALAGNNGIKRQDSLLTG